MVGKKRIKLSDGNHFVTVSAMDFTVLKKYKWHLLVSGKSKYAFRTVKKKRKQTNFLMHREIIGAKPGEITDHKDGNGLNNSRENIRVCNFQENSMNQRTQTRQKTSRFKGVSWHKRQKIWRAYIKIDRTSIHLGHFKKEADAAMAYDFAAIGLFENFANLNTT